MKKKLNVIKIIFLLIMFNVALYSFILLHVVLNSGAETFYFFNIPFSRIFVFDFALWSLIIVINATLLYILIKI